MSVMDFSPSNDRYLQKVVEQRLQRLAEQVGLEELRDVDRLVDEDRDVEAAEAVRRLRALEDHFRTEERR